VRKHQTRNLEIPGSMLSHRPGMTAKRSFLHHSATVGMQQRQTTLGDSFQ
jgi:hypothetical protein